VLDDAPLAVNWGFIDQFAFRPTGLATAAISLLPSYIPYWLRCQRNFL